MEDWQDDYGVRVLRCLVQLCAEDPAGPVRHERAGDAHRFYVRRDARAVLEELLLTVRGRYPPPDPRSDPSRVEEVRPRPGTEGAAIDPAPLTYEFIINK